MRLFKRQLTGNTPDAQAQLEQFRAKYRPFLETIDAFPLDVVVWGPGLKSATLTRQKREDIKLALLACGHNAMFSEDLTDLDGQSDLASEEFAQALAAHLIIILLDDESQGSIGETHQYAVHPSIAWKALILAPVVLRAGFTGQTALRLLDEGYRAVRWYEQSELISCSVVTHVLVLARARRVVYAMHMQRQGSTT